MQQVLATAATLQPTATTVDQAEVLLVDWSDVASLVAMAMEFPGARFVLVQSNSDVCERTLGLATGAGAGNVRVLHASVSDLADDFGRFDYIIAHGFYSFASEDSRESLWRVAQGSLSTSDMLFVSYAVLPGAGQNLLLRDFVQLASRGISDPSRREDCIWDAVSILSTHQQSGHPLACEAARVFGLGREAAVDGELHPGRRAFRFGEVVEAAAEANLRYIGELFPIDLEKQPGADRLAGILHHWTGRDEVFLGELLDVVSVNTRRGSFFAPLAKGCAERSWER